MAFLKFEIGPPEKKFPIFSQKFVPTLDMAEFLVTNLSRPINGEKFILG